MKTTSILTSLAAALGVAFIATLMAGCASGPVPPDWQGSVLGATERGTEAWLTGRARIEQAEFARARSDIARTGKADLIGRVELMQCASRVASLVFEECTGFERLAADAGAAERAYARYLAGRAGPEDIPLLPAAHREVIIRGTPAVQAITQPLSRMVAAGVLFRMDRADPALIELATGTASDRGWNRPLLAWLSVQQRRAELAGDVTEAARIKRRIDLVAPLAPR